MSQPEIPTENPSPNNSSDDDEDTYEIKTSHGYMLEAFDLFKKKKTK
jgi:hypothetical protein